MEEFVTIFLVIIGVVIVLGLVDRLLGKSDIKNISLKISDIEERVAEISDEVSAIVKMTSKRKDEIV